MTINIDKPFASHLSIMLESKLIWYKHYQLFCDDIIEEHAAPPYWIIELAVTRNQAHATEIVNQYIHS